MLTSNLRAVCKCSKSSECEGLSEQSPAPAMPVRGGNVGWLQGEGEGQADADLQP